MSLFCSHTKHQTLQNMGFSRHKGKTQNGTFGCKGAILGRGLESGLTICETQKLRSAENAFLVCFQQNTAWQNKRVYVQKNRNLPKIVGCLPTCKRRFLCLFFFGGFVYFSSVFFLFVKKAQKGYFPAVLVFFCVPPKGPSLKILLFFLPFMETFLFYFCLSFVNVCLFLKTNSPNISFLKSMSFSFSAVFRSSAVCVFMVYVSAFLFLCWFCFLVCFSFVIVFCFLFAFRL